MRLVLGVLAFIVVPGVARAQQAFVEAYGHDESDGSDVGWNSGYPHPSFDDDPNRRGLPNAVWEGEHRLGNGQLCLVIRNLNAPYPPAHTLAVGYTVRLSGAAFDDGTTARTFVLLRFSGHPAQTGTTHCVGLRGGGGLVQPPPPPVVGDRLGSVWSESESGWSGVWTRRGRTNAFDAVWTAGGGRVTAVLTIMIVGSTVRISRRQSSDGNDCHYLGTLRADGVTVDGTYSCSRVPGTHQWRAVIGGGGGGGGDGSSRSPAAHGLWGVGVQLGFAEHGAALGASPAMLAQSFAYARDLAQQSGCLPIDEIESLRRRMLATRDSRSLYPEILSLRTRFAQIVQSSCACLLGGPQAAHGVWGVGVQMGFAEIGSSMNVSPSLLTQSLGHAVDLARQGQCLPLEEIERLRVRMAQTGSSRVLYDEILAMRVRYAEIVTASCSCGGSVAQGPPPPAPPPVCNPSCPPSHVCVNGVCVGTGSLRVTLTWDRPGDVDLHVVTPAGNDIHYASRTADGGELDRDDRSGTGPENVFWDTSPPPGTYLVCVTPYSISGPTTFSLGVHRSGRASLTLNGARHTTTGNRTCDRGAPEFVTDFQVP